MKLKIICLCSTLSLFCENCVFGMDFNDDMDWEMTVSNYPEQKEIQELKQQLLDCEQKREESNKIIEELEQQLKNAKTMVFSLKQSQPAQIKSTSPANTNFSFGSNKNDTTVQKSTHRDFNPASTDIKLASTRNKKGIFGAFMAQPFKQNQQAFTTPEQSHLFEAIKNGNLSDASNAIKNGANVNEANSFGWTPLHLAVYDGLLEIVKLLVENGADINAKTDVDERTPLYIARLNHHQEIIDYLKSKGAK